MHTNVIVPGLLTTKLIKGNESIVPGGDGDREQGDPVVGTKGQVPLNSTPVDVAPEMTTL